MKLRFRHTPSLPRLSWCARIESGSGVVEVEHGPDVEIRDDFFFEGAWSGPLDVRSYLESPTLCGTGGVIEGDRISFTGSTDRQSPLFSIQKRGVVHVSNSPVFAMTAADEKPDDLYPFYFYDFLRYWRMGLHCMRGKLKLASGNHLCIHFGNILHVGARGEIHFSLHRQTRVPVDFASYHAILLEELRRLFDNALDPGRRFAFHSLASLSRGYDSSACAALASRAGCREAFTFTNSRSANPAEDSGKENAGLLGMACREVDRWAHVGLAGLVDAEFALLGVSAPTPLAVLQDHLPGRLLISGNWGDLLWDPRASGKCGNMTIPWSRFIAGLGHIEYRLRAGYQLFSPATIAARHNQAIHQIALSPEMKPWWTGTEYDRPLARRIAEDAGLPRGSFGMEKYASSQTNYAGPGGFSREGLKSYQDFVKQIGGRAVSALWKLRVECRHFLWKHLASKSRIYRPYSCWHTIFPYIGHTHPRIVPWDFLFTFAWAHRVLCGRYVISRHTDKP